MLSVVAGAASPSAVTGRNLLLLLPIAVIEVGLLVLALVDIANPERRVVGGSKLVWVLVVVLVSTTGPLIYLLFGHQHDA